MFVSIKRSRRVLHCASNGIPRRCVDFPCIKAVWTGRELSIDQQDQEDFTSVNDCEVLKQKTLFCSNQSINQSINWSITYYQGWCTSAVFSEINPFIWLFCLISASERTTPLLLRGRQLRPVQAEFQPGGGRCPAVFYLQRCAAEEQLLRHGTRISNPTIKHQIEIRPVPISKHINVWSNFIGECQYWLHWRMKEILHKFIGDFLDRLIDWLNNLLLDWSRNCLIAWLLIH